MALKFAWTVAAACAAALCGCESIAGIQDIALSSDASDVDVDASVVADGSAEASVEASGQDSAVAEGGAVDGNAPASDSASDSTAESVVDAPEEVLEASADQAVSSADVAATDGAGPEDSTVPDGSSASDSAAESSTPVDASDAGDAGAAPDGSGVPDAANGSDGAAGADAGDQQLVLIDDQLGTSSGEGWLDGPGMKGTWYTYVGDALSTINPPPDAGPAPIIGTMARSGSPSSNAAHVAGTVGSSATTSSAGMGFNLINGTAGYDASAYKGITFWGRSGLDAGTTIVRFQVKSVNTETYLTLYGFTYGEDLHFTSDWSQFTVLFADMTPNSWYTGDAGPPTFTDSANLISCQFQLGANVSFDIWVDDVYFLVGP